MWWQRKRVVRDRTLGRTLKLEDVLNGKAFQPGDIDLDWANIIATRFTREVKPLSSHEFRLLSTVVSHACTVARACERSAARIEHQELGEVLEYLS